MSHDNRNTGLNRNEFEFALAGVRPQPSQLSRDRLLFESGRQAERIRTSRARRLSLCVTGAAGVAAASFACLLASAKMQLADLEVALRARPAPAIAATGIVADTDDFGGTTTDREPPQVLPQPVLREPGVAEQSVAPSALALGPLGDGRMNYLSLRNRALRLGSDALADGTWMESPERGASVEDAAIHRELPARQLNPSVRQPAGSSPIRRILPLFDGDQS